VNIVVKLVVFLFLFVLIFNPYAWGHKVNIYAYQDGNMIYTESYFPDGKRIIGGVVEVYDLEGKKLLDGKTDREGAFNFQLQEKKDIKIVLEASLGHRAEYSLSAEYKKDTDKRKNDRAAGVSFRDIIAGLGCIFGIAGIVMYSLKRR